MIIGGQEMKGPSKFEVFLVNQSEGNTNAANKNKTNKTNLLRWLQKISNCPMLPTSQNRSSMKAERT